MLDAPVSGSVITLEQGKLSMMVGGDAATFERVLPLLRDIGPKATYVGGNGLAVLDEDRHQPEPRRADAGVLRRRAAGGEVRASRAKTAVEVLTQQRDRVADGEVSRAVRARDARGSVVQLNMMQKDMTLALEIGRAARRSAADHRDRQRDPHGRPRHGPRPSTTSP